MKREVKIGIFTIVIICCSWAGIRFLSGIDIFGRNIAYYASYENINGISSASPIMIQGVKVGKVTDIILDPLTSDKVTVKLSIKNRYKIPDNSTAKIFSPGLMSSMAIGIELGDSPTMLSKNSNIATLSEESIMDLAADKLIDITEQISIISKELNTTLISVNALLESNGQNIEQTITNLSTISEELSDLLVSQNSNLEESIKGIAQFSSTLGETTPQIENIICNLDAITQELQEANISSSLGEALTELNTTLTKVNSAEGSVGKLVNDEALYENLAAVSASLNELLIDMQQNPKRYVHFSLFGSKE